MFEKYHLYHYEIPTILKTKTQIYEVADMLDDIDSSILISERNFGPDSIALMDNTTFHLNGYSEILPYIPQPADERMRYLTLQTFALMHNPKGYDTRRSNNDSMLLLYTTGGSGWLEYEGECLLLSEGSLVWIDCRKPHYYRTEGTFWDHIDLHLQGPSLTDLHQEFLQEHTLLCSRESSAAYLSEIDTILSVYTTPHKHRGLLLSQALEHLLIRLICDCDTGRKGSGSSEAFQETLQYLTAYMQNHYTEKLTLDFLADFSGYSKYYLAREFRKYTGFPLGEYLLQLRMEHARQLLKSTALPVQEIGAAVGIENDAYFSRIFKEKNGLTPGEYRRQQSPGD